MYFGRVIKIEELSDARSSSCDSDIPLSKLKSEKSNSDSSVSVPLINLTKHNPIDDWYISDCDIDGEDKDPTSKTPHHCFTGICHRYKGTNYTHYVSGSEI